LKMGKDIEDLKLERESSGNGGRFGDRGGRGEGSRGRNRDFSRGARSEGGRGRSEGSRSRSEGGRGKYEGKPAEGSRGKYEGKSEGGRGGRYGEHSGRPDERRGNRPEGERFTRKDKDKNGKSVHFSEVSEKMLGGITKKYTKKPGDTKPYGEKKARSYEDPEHKSERFYGKDEHTGRAFEGKTDKKKKRDRMPQSGFSAPSDRVTIKTRGTDGKFYE